MIITSCADVVLRDFEEKDIVKKVEWINNPDNHRYLHYDLPLKIDRTTQWFRNKDNTERVDCVIEYRGIPVGLIGLLHIDKKNSKAEYYVTIGEPRYKHKGIATKATEAIISHAFGKLRLHKLYLTVDAANDRAIRLYEKTGFKPEGYFKDDLFCPAASSYIDRKRYALLNDSENDWGGGEREKLKLCYAIRNPVYATPIYELGLEGGNRLFIKRDDLIPYLFGGNKYRKAVNFFDEIDRGSYTSVVTYGSGSSNHLRVTAGMCADRGLPCHVVTAEETAGQTYNSLLTDWLGAKRTICPVFAVHDTIEEVLTELSTEGHRPYFIPGGGHGNLGTAAYVECFSEIKQYEKDAGIRFDYIFHASGTGTTQAGLISGKLTGGDEKQGIGANIVGISIARKNPYGRSVVTDSVREYIGEDDRIDGATVFIDDYVGDGYGTCEVEVNETVRQVFRRWGIPLDTTYTGKAFWGMEKYIEKEHIAGKNILFIHTGGTPLFFDDLKNVM